jgi:hypothetical protein
MNKRIDELNSDTMVPGIGDLDLSGVSDTQIKSLRLQKMMGAAKVEGHDQAHEPRHHCHVSRAHDEIWRARLWWDDGREDGAA